MVARRATRSFLAHAAVGLAVISACRSAPQLPRVVTVVPGEPTSISLQARGGLVLTLQNESAAAPESVYSAAADPMQKVVPDGELQALLDVLAAERLFDYSLQSVPTDARDTLIVTQFGRRWVWARRVTDDEPRAAAFQSGRSYFLALYNGNTAYHSGSERPDFRAEAARARETERDLKQRPGSAPRSDG